MATQPSSSPLGFSEAELALLARTADALTAFTGRPVLAETGITDDVPWVVFGVPLHPDDEEDDESNDETIVWKMGSAPGVEWVGNAGGLAPRPDDIFECQLLWAIQITPVEGERFIKLDEHGEVVAWSDDLSDLLPFVVDGEWRDDVLLVPEDDDDDDEDDDDQDDDEPRRGRWPLH